MATTDSTVALGKSQNLPYDIQTQQDLIRRKRLISQAMLAQAMSGQTPLTIGSALNWSGILGDVIKGKMAKDQLAQYDTEENKLAADYQNRMTEGFKKFTETKLGKPAVPGTPGQEATDPGGTWMPGTPGQAAVKGDPLKAAMDAISSNIEPLRAMGMEEYKNFLKNKENIDPEKILSIMKDYTPESVKKYLQTKDLSVLEPRVTIHSAGDGRFSGETGTGVMTTLNPNQDKWSEPVPATTDIPAYVRNLSTGETKPLGLGAKPPVDQTVGPLAHMDAKIIEEGRNKAIEGRNGLGYVANAQALLKQVPDGLIGPVGDQVLTANKFLTQFGIPAMDPAKIASAEQFKATMGNVLLEKIRALAPVTEQDIKEVNNIITSLGTNTRAGIEGALRLLERRYANQIQDHNSQLEQLETSDPRYKGLRQRYGVDFSVGPIANLGADGGGGTGAAAGQPTLDDLRKLYGRK